MTSWVNAGDDSGRPGPPGSDGRASARHRCKFPAGTLSGAPAQGHTGRRVALSLAGGSRPLSDRNGFWTAGNLPAAPLAVLAWRLGVNNDAAAGLLDSQSVPVAFPWPERLEIHAIE